MNELVRNVLMGAAGSAGDSTFVDDVFSTYLYKGNDSSITVNNSLDLSTEGGLVWVKNRTTSYGHFLFDTERGTTTALSTNLTNANFSEPKGVTSFNTNGFTIGGSGADAAFNSSSHDYASWSFRKAKGFFDIVKYTPSGGTNTISHNLGCVPGMIIVKNLNNSENWAVYHRGTDPSDANNPNSYGLKLNENGARFTGANWNVTATTFDAAFSLNNNDGDEHIAYLFAGGASTAATARSVDFDGAGDYLKFEDSNSGIAVGTGNFTCEFWIKFDGSITGNDALIDTRTAAQNTANGFQIYVDSDGKVLGWVTGDMFGSTTAKLPINVWNHIAVVRASSNATKLYVNGIQSGVTYTGSQDFSNSELVIGANAAGGTETTARISNLRLTKGQALYTSSFRPSTEPFTTTSQGAIASNVKILACNNSSVTGGTVIPSSPHTYSINVTASSSSAYTLSGNDSNGSVSGNNATVTVSVGNTLNFAVNASGHPFYIRDSNGGYNVSTPAATNQGSQSGTVSWTPNTAGSFVYQCGNHSGMMGIITVNAASGSVTANGNPTATTDSPFDDIGGFQFGEEGDQNIIKMGSYLGNGLTDGPEIYLGWEPSFIILKCSSHSGENWEMYDSMRGLANKSSGTAFLKPNDNGSEATGTIIELNSTGFKLKDSSGSRNNDAKNYIYIAIRRPDGLVGKPVELGTDVFAMDTGNGSSTIPAYDSGFAVDYALTKLYASAQYWQSTSRLTGTGNLETNAARAEESLANYIWDSNVGVHKNYGSTHQAWMWKRHAGFTTVAYEGDGVAGRQIAHDMNNSVGMIWIKNRDSTKDWVVGHQGLNGGTNPWEYHLVLNDTAAESDNTTKGFNDTAPTSTHFTLGSHSAVNAGGNSFIAMLFSSVDGISKVGYYAGSSSGLTITTGFAPRFLILKNITDNGSGWIVLDTTRGWGSGNDYALNINNSEAQNNFDDIGYPTSTGFYVGTVNSQYNAANKNYIYYAHA